MQSLKGMLAVLTYEINSNIEQGMISENEISLYPAQVALPVLVSIFKRRDMRGSAVTIYQHGCDWAKDNRSHEAIQCNGVIFPLCNSSTSSMC